MWDQAGVVGVSEKCTHTKCTVIASGCNVKDVKLGTVRLRCSYMQERKREVRGEWVWIYLQSVTSEFRDDPIWKEKDYKNILCNCLTEYELVYAGKIIKFMRIFAVVSLSANLRAKDAYCNYGVFCIVK